jgi:hypothetical protein
MAHRYLPLPKISTSQEWCCGGKGNGPCEVVSIDFEYSRTECNGELLDNETETRWVCKCCGVEPFLWDNAIGNSVDVDWNTDKGGA